MISAFNDIPLKPKVINLSITERCNAACRICATHSNPSRNNSEIDVAEALEWINQAGYIEEVIAICFTGGEPFLDIPKMKHLAKQAFRLGLKVSVVTNCFWAGKYTDAYSIIAQLKNVGLSRLTVSADSFHQEFVPIDAVDNAILAANKLGIPCSLNCVVGQDSKSLDKVIKTLTHGSCLDTVSEINCLPIGRAKNLPSLKNSSSNLQRCPIIISTISIKPDGAVYACCGIGGFTQPLQIGNLKNSSLKQIFALAVQNPLILSLSIYGPLYLFSAINGESQVKSLSCLDECSVCHEMLSNSKQVEKMNKYLSKQVKKINWDYKIISKIKKNTNE